MRTIERRLQELEQQTSGPAGFELWIGGDDGDDLLGPQNESMSRAEFEARYPHAITIGGPYETD